ncbi:M20/M25/M40 family metallo-hydrolase [Rubrivirga marina]|uniref:Peptidase M20 n=1 Tax=Rubrivirga marina TaxID=1196024 RepID=A0A271IV19_9BACT|nr:M20/M25/M40 family metallo-hydrolase [Rubrivirga marina]PAP74960.1 peptidase M20 [Rubrivirga marina]
MNVLDLHADLVRIPSLSFKEKAAADYVEMTLRQVDGLDVGRLDENVWASLGDGDEVLLLCSHLDVVPPSEGHPYPPFSPTRVDGAVYGRGAVDAKASGAAMLTALVELAESGWRPPSGGRLVVALTECEETGAENNGMEKMRARVFGDALPEPTAALVGEPTELRPCLAQKGLLILNATAHGETAHAARAHLGKNALTVAARDLLAVDALDYDTADPLLGKPTFTATLIEGGTAKNVVPDRCRFTLDVRSTPAATHAELTSFIRGALESRVEVYSDRLIPCSTPADAPIARATVAALAGLGLDAEPFGSPTASDWIHLSDVPAVKIGPGRSELSHTPDEHVEIDQLERAVEVYADITRRYFTSAES